MLAIVQKNTLITQGDDCMKREDYIEAVSFYKKAIAIDAKDISTNEKLAAALKGAEDYKTAEAVYAMLDKNTAASAINKFYYAQVLCINQKYLEATLVYQSYFNQNPNDSLANEFKNFGEKIKTMLADTGRYNLINIPQNTSASDEGPAFCLYDLCITTNHQKTLARQRTFNLYMAYGDSFALAFPEKFKGDMQLNEGPATFSNNGKEMIFTRSNYPNKGTDGLIKQGLYHADFDAKTKKWVNVKPLNLTNYNYNVMQPSLSKDGSTLFFASDMNGGMGGTDIYVSYKKGDTWSTPVNAGSSINTTGNEKTPFIAPDGILYFASDSRAGLGGFDIYSAKFSHGISGRATNLGASINSAYNDFGFITNPSGTSGYIVSNRPGGKGGNDIYQFKPVR